ncbi:MAG TPA: hypothetical protein VM925_10025 [Labilithrix sp.]|nr:hypothetical protein [Labilithrix sp.]
MFRPLLSSTLLLLPLLVVACTSDDPNTSRTGAYALDDLVVRVSTTVRTPSMGLAHVTLGAKSAELFVGEGDELFLVNGGARQDAISTPTSGFSFVPPSADENLAASFVRDGRVYPVPLWQGPLPTVTVPQELAMGATVDIDISPRPAPGTKVFVALRSCLGVASVQLETLPWKLDTTTEIQKNADSSEACCEGVATDRRCTVRVESEYETSTRPFESGPFHPSSEVRVHHYLQSDTFLRL